MTINSLPNKIRRRSLNYTVMHHDRFLLKFYGAIPLLHYFKYIKIEA